MLQRFFFTLLIVPSVFACTSDSSVATSSKLNQGGDSSAVELRDMAGISTDLDMLGGGSEAGLDIRSDLGLVDLGVVDSGGVMDLQDASFLDASLADIGLPEVDLGPSLDMSQMPEMCACYAGEGQYCASLVQAYASDQGCVLPQLTLGDRLWSCRLTADGESQWSEGELCEHGCEAGELASADHCGLPLCDCFVRVSWCGASAGRHAEENLGCRVPLLPDRDNDLLGCDNGTWIVLESCEYGCLEQATGTPDACRLFPDLGEEQWPECPSESLLHSGLHPEASDRLRCAGVTESRISQTIGSAPASAGYHAADGTANGLDYCAAVDLRTRDLSTAQILELLDRLGRNGFAAWYRQPGADGWPSSQSPHIHAVFAGVEMKSQLREQVRDFLENKNGLSSHTQYQFWDIPVEIKSLIAELFGRHYTP